MFAIFVLTAFSSRKHGSHVIGPNFRDDVGSILSDFATYSTCTLFQSCEITWVHYSHILAGRDDFSKTHEMLWPNLRSSPHVLFSLKAQKPCKSKGKHLERGFIVVLQCIAGMVWQPRGINIASMWLWVKTGSIGGFHPEPCSFFKTLGWEVFVSLFFLFVVMKEYANMVYIGKDKNRQYDSLYWFGLLTTEV